MDEIFLNKEKKYVLIILKDGCEIIYDTYNSIELVEEQLNVFKEKHYEYQFLIRETGAAYNGLIADISKSVELANEQINFFKKKCDEYQCLVNLAKGSGNLFLYSPKQIFEIISNLDIENGIFYREFETKYGVLSEESKLHDFFENSSTEKKEIYFKNVASILCEEKTYDFNSFRSDLNNGLSLRLFSQLKNDEQELIYELTDLLTKPSNKSLINNVVNGTIVKLLNNISTEITDSISSSLFPKNREDDAFLLEFS